MDLNYEIRLFLLISLLAIAIGWVINITNKYSIDIPKNIGNLYLLLRIEKIYLSTHILSAIAALFFAIITNNYNVVNVFLIVATLIFIVTSFTGVAIAFLSYLYLLVWPDNFKAQRMLLIGILFFLPGIKYFPMGCIIVYVVFYFSSFF